MCLSADKDELLEAIMGKSPGGQRQWLIHRDDHHPVIALQPLTHLTVTLRVDLGGGDGKTPLLLHWASLSFAIHRGMTPQPQVINCANLLNCPTGTERTNTQQAWNNRDAS
jgi:hypothetical protein